MEVVIFLWLPALVLAAPKVSCPWGKVEGVDITSREGVLYYGYYGIPYAKPPVGELRFRKPVPHPGVSEVFNASRYGAKCLQITGFDVDRFNDTSRGEDCLTLNVFLSNTTKPSSRKSVMVWIHGGGWTWGHARSYEPWMLVSKGDVIAVTIQYRLGVFGFLTTGSDVSPGNYGLWDQHVAIKWVKDNIEGFGGDKNDITIIGESSGAASVDYHILYPGSKGLFNKAVLQSGTATSMWALGRNIPGLTAYLGYILGCTSEKKDLRKRQEDIMTCLRTKDSRELLLYSYFGGPMTSQLIFYPWIPCVDGDFIVDEPRFLMQNETFLESTTIKDVDVMLGLNNNEGAYPMYLAYRYDRIYNYTYVKDIVKQSMYEEDFVPTITRMAFGRNSPKINNVIDVMYTFPRPPPSEPLPRDQIFETYADPGFVAPSILFLRTHSKMAANRKCFFYLFNHFPSYTGSNPIKGIIHGQDTVYLFNLSPRTVRGFGNTGTITEKEYQLSDTFVKLIAEFVKRGDPNGIIEPKLGKRWPQFDTNKQQYLSFTTNLSTGSDLYPDRVKLWLDVLPNLVTEWNQSDEGMTTVPKRPITTPSPSLFDLDRHTAEIAILTLIIVLSVTLVGLVILCLCWCLKHRKSPKEKYDIR